MCRERAIVSLRSEIALPADRTPFLERRRPIVHIVGRCPCGDIELVIRQYIE